MKRWLIWIGAVTVMSMAAGWVYSQYFSTRAQIKAASSAFMRAAVSGDEAAVQAYLAPDSPMTAAEIVRLYQGDTFNNFNVYPIQTFPNGSGVPWLANTSTVPPSGPGAKGVTLALKRVSGRWLIFKAGDGFAL